MGSIACGLTLVANGTASFRLGLDFGKARTTRGTSIDDLESSVDDSDVDRLEAGPMNAVLFESELSESVVVFVPHGHTHGSVGFDIDDRWGRSAELPKSIVATMGERGRL